MKELLFSITKKDLNITYFSGKGAGGQHRNKHMNCVRLNHKDSGTLVTGQSFKSKQRNITQALDNLTRHPKFINWHKTKVQQLLDNMDVETYVDEQMKYIKIECLKEEKWVEYNPEAKRQEQAPTPKYLHKADKEKRRSKKRTRVKVTKDDSYHDYEGGD